MLVMSILDDDDVDEDEEEDDGTLQSNYLTPNFSMVLVPSQKVTMVLIFLLCAILGMLQWGMTYNNAMQYSCNRTGTCRGETSQSPSHYPTPTFLLNLW